MRYVRVMPEVTIDGSALGWSWEVTYNAATKEEADSVKHKQGTTYWWLPDDDSRTTTAVLPTIHKEPRASEQVFSNSVIRLSLAGTMFATVVTWRWSSFTVRHGWFGCAVHGLLHGGETCRVRVAERRRALRTPLCHFPVCLQCHAGRHSALQWGVTRAPHLRQSVFTPRRGSVSLAQK